MPPCTRKARSERRQNISPRLGRNLVLAISLGVAVYLTLFAFLGIKDVGAALMNFHLWLVPAIVGLVGLSYVVRFFRWSYYLKIIDVSLPHLTNAAIFVSGLSMTISPGKLGEMLKSVFIRQMSGEPVAHTAPTVVAERATDATGMVAWGLLGALALGLGPATLLLFLGLTAVGIVVVRSERLSLRAARAVGKVPLLWRLAPHMTAFQGSSNILLKLRPLIVGTGLSFLGWGLECVAVYLCVLGLGVQQPFMVVVFIFAVSSLAGALSFVPGGIGVADAGLAAMFGTLAGLSGGLAGAATFVIRLVTMWFATLLGLLGLFVVQRLVGRGTLSQAQTRFQPTR